MKGVHEDDGREHGVFFESTVNVFTVNEVTKLLAPGHPGEAGDSRRSDMKGKNILLVDDDRDLVQTTKTFLEARGYTVATAYSGIEARDELKLKRPDLVVLDIMMDYDTDGFNVAYKLKNDPETARIPVIIVSGFTKELETKTHIFEPMMYRDWPAAKFFEKPVKLGALADAVADLLAGAEVPSDSPQPVDGVQV
jgi:CheY-like chemotaxis protein